MELSWYETNGPCEKCKKTDKVCRLYRGGDEDTFDFYICKDCEVWLFKQFGQEVICS